MGKLPGGERAIVDAEKVVGYLLNPDHRVGRHKARVFASALGLALTDADALIAALKAAAMFEEAAHGDIDAFGQRYVIEFEMTHGVKVATIRSSWIIRRGEDFPRFVTAMVAKQDLDND